MEYLTEAQDTENGGPLLVDIDIKYNSDIKERQHSTAEISDILQLYIECIKNVFDIDEDLNFKVWIFEKDNVNCLEKEGITKDGIHFVFGISMKHDLQRLLRDVVINKENNEMKIFKEEGLNCKNKTEDIFDLSISRGSTNWQVWGSRKPNHEAYKLKYEASITIDEDDFEIELEEVEKVNTKKMLPIITATNDSFHKMTSIKECYKEKLKEISKKKKKKIKLNKKNTKSNLNLSLTNIDLLNISSNFPVNENELDELIEKIFNSLDIKDYGLKEIHDIVMCFDENYYDPFEPWLHMGWALHNTNDILFWTWIKFSSKSAKFNYADIPERYVEWQNMKEDGYSFRSIYYWAQNSFPEEFKKIRDESITKFLWATKNTTGADNDLAILAKHIFKGKFACISIKHNKWYLFNGTRWKTNDSGTSLRMSLSGVLNQLYIQQCYIEKENSIDEEKTAAEREKHLQNSQIFNKIAMKLKESSKKSSIMIECKEAFYDENLVEKLDSNPYLLGFNNGIYDFKTGEFRMGEPEDYVSFSTGRNYVPFDNLNDEHIRKKAEIEEFMSQIFPSEDVRQYMWEHAAATLIGNNRNQKFNIYTGCGGNGKSKFINLVNMSLGDYAEKLNIALITQKRKAAGGPSPEMAKLKGVRYVTMDEPTKGDVLNEGIVKQLTGGDEITCREMYSPRELKFIPQFELACCTNNMFEINSTDNGIWRRIRQVDFTAEFIDEDKYLLKKENGLCDNPDYPIYVKDDQLDEKLESWVEVFTALIIEIANKNQGKVNDCETVLKASREYQEKQNYCAQFVKEKIIKGTPTDKIKKNDVRSEFNEWFQSENNRKPPKFRELEEYLNKTIGKYRNRAWWGFKINYDAYASEDDSFASDDN